jgi:hypothetical protein
MKTKQVVANLREFAQNNSNTTLDPKLCEDIRYLCDEVDRFGVQMLLMNEYGDEDYITIQKYKSKLEKCQSRLDQYEPF